MLTLPNFNCSLLVSIVILSVDGILCLVNVINVIILIFKFHQHFSQHKHKKHKINKKITIICVITAILYLIAGIGQTAMSIGFQDCNRSNDNSNIVNESIFFRVGVSINMISYFPALIGLYSLFSSKLLLIFDGTLYPVSTTTRKSFTIFKNI